jgi:hypothetical protein
MRRSGPKRLPTIWRRPPSRAEPLSRIAPAEAPLTSEPPASLTQRWFCRERMVTPPFQKPKTDLPETSSPFSFHVHIDATLGNKSSTWREPWTAIPEAY